MRKALTLFGAAFVLAAGSFCNYLPPHWNVFMLLNEQLTPISSRCRVVSNCGRDTSRAASREAGLIASSGTLLA